MPSDFNSRNSDQIILKQESLDAFPQDGADPIN